MPKFNMFQLKIFMASLMVLDHIAFFIPQYLVLPFHIITRCVAPFFAFAAVEGFVHTSNRRRYNLRLSGFAILMQTGNYFLDMAFRAKQIEVSGNFILTLACGVLILTLLEKFLESPWWLKLGKLSLVSIIFLAGSFFTDGGFYILPFMLITYYLRHKPAARNIIYLSLSIALFWAFWPLAKSVGLIPEVLFYQSGFFFISVLPFIYFYNGESGPKTKFNKYFFYIFYPGHLWLIALISYLIK